MEEFSITDLSVEPSATRNLSAKQRDRLAVLLDEYLVGLERGAPPNVVDLVADDPELAEPLKSYVNGLEDLHQVAAGFAPRSNQVDDNEVDDGSGEGERSRTRLGDFELIEEVGRGGMGVVYRAQQRSLDRTVAIKLLPFAAVLDSRQITRFRNEAQAAAQLQHPNIVPVYTVGVDRGVHYYAMQLIEGQSFAEAIVAHTENHTLPEVETWVRRGIAVAGALHAAHETGVVHRDIKPSNLLLGNDGQVWVTDFGLARCQTDVTMTRTGDIVGTMKYMSPEQARGESAIVDGRTDVYSLGVTLYEMLCLRPAFDGGETPVVLRQIEEHSPTPIRSIRPDVPQSLDTVIAKAMSKNRDSRYDTALEFAEDLRRVLDGAPTIARNPTFLDRAAQWAVARKRAVAAGVAFGLILLVGLAVSIALIAAAKQESDQNAILAKRSSQLARTTVDELGAKMAELLADIPEAESVRRQLLQETLAYYQSFADQVDDDPQLIKDLAVTYGKIGSLQNEIGSSDQAIEALRESRSLFIQLVQDQPGDWELVHQLATSENNLALALDRAGRYKFAEDHYQSAIELGELLVQSDDGNAEWRRGLSLALGNYALLLGKTQRIEESEQMLEQSLVIASIGENEANSDYDDTLQRQLASTYQNLSALLAEQSPQKSIEYAQEALRYQTDALSKNENDAQLASQVALTLNSLGAAQAASADHEGAILSYRQAADIQRQLHDRQPYALTHQRDLAVTENNLGLALAAEGQYEPARQAFDRALGFQQLLAAEFDEDAEIQSTLGGIYNNLGFVQEKLSDRPGALRSYRMAVRYQKAAHQAADEVPRYREFLSKHYYNCARLLREDGQTDDSIEFTLQRRGLWLSEPSRLSGVADEFLTTATVINLNKSSPEKRTHSREDCVRFARETVTMAIREGFDPPPEFFDRPEYQDLRPNTSLQGI